MYDLAISFAGENRDVAEALAIALRKEGYAIFYDDFEKAELWGRDLSVELPLRYNKSTFCIMLLSHYYLDKMWTILERQVIISKFLQLKGNDYILPVRLDGFSGEVPGISKLTGYINIDSKTQISYLIDLTKSVLANRLKKAPIRKD